MCGSSLGTTITVARIHRLNMHNHTYAVVAICGAIAFVPKSPFGATRQMLRVGSAAFARCSSAQKGGQPLRTARIRFRIEVVLAVLAAGLAVLTLITREWIEIVFGIDPDKGSGALEWAIAAALFVASAALALIARWDRKRQIAAAG